MNIFLEKVSWLTRRWNFKFRLFDIYGHDEHARWGFSFFTIQYKVVEYSALRILITLPNKTNVQKVLLNNWDILFLKNFLYKTYERLQDIKLWGGKLTQSEKIMLNILNKIVK